jgi:hypothetical protein
MYVDQNTGRNKVTLKAFKTSISILPNILIGYVYFYVWVNILFVS